MSTKTSITSEKVVNYIKEKWQIFGVSSALVFIVQILSTKLLTSILLGLIIAALLPSDTIKKVTKKVSKKDEST
tara:strand:- start:108 stop:329 length:222 start_codon:yes stop_codon:yes gene_type:complete